MLANYKGWLVQDIESGKIFGVREIVFNERFSKRSPGTFAQIDADGRGPLQLLPPAASQQLVPPAAPQQLVPPTAPQRTGSTPPVAVPPILPPRKVRFTGLDELMEDEEDDDAGALKIDDVKDRRTGATSCGGSI